MKLKVKQHTYTFKPTSYTVSETGHPGARKIMSVRRGTWVMDVAVRVGVLFNGTTPTISIGDGASATIFALTADVACTATGLKHGYGAAFSGANGKLYTTTDTIDLAYTAAGDTTVGECTVIITYADLE